VEKRSVDILRHSDERFFLANGSGGWTGITATHAISFEAKTPVFARFDSAGADNQWSISAHTLRRLMDHFGPKVELLDINTEGEGVLNLTCSTEKQYTKTDGMCQIVSSRTEILFLTEPT
jgi:hypothetical protein